MAHKSIVSLSKKANQLLINMDAIVFGKKKKWAGFFCPPNQPRNKEKDTDTHMLSSTLPLCSRFIIQGLGAQLVWVTTSAIQTGQRWSWDSVQSSPHRMYLQQSPHTYRNAHTRTHTETWPAYLARKRERGKKSSEVVQFKFHQLDICACLLNEQITHMHTKGKEGASSSD